MISIEIGRIRGRALLCASYGNIAAYSTFEQVCEHGSFFFIIDESGGLDRLMIL